MRPAQRRIGASVGVLEVRVERPLVLGVGPQDVVDARVVQRRDGGEGGLRRLAQIAAADEGQGVLLGHGIGDQPGQPVVAVGIVAVGQRDLDRQRAVRVVDLHAAAHRRLQVPQQAAVHVEVLEGPGVLGAHQGRQLARLDAPVAVGHDLDVGVRQVAEGLVRRVLGVHHVGVGHPERSQRIGAGLQVELEHPIGLLDLDLGVGEVSGPVVVGRRDGVGLAVQEARELAGDIDLAEGPRVEAVGLRIGGKAGRHRWRAQRIGVRGRAKRQRRPRGAQSEFQKLHYLSPVRARRH